MSGYMERVNAMAANLDREGLECMKRACMAFSRMESGELDASQLEIANRLFVTEGGRAREAWRLSGAIGALSALVGFGRLQAEEVWSSQLAQMSRRFLDREPPVPDEPDDEQPKVLVH